MDDLTPRQRYRALHPDRVLESHAKYRATELGRATRRRAKVARVQDSEKRRAQNAVVTAVRYRGQVARPASAVRAGRTPITTWVMRRSTGSTSCGCADGTTRKRTVNCAKARSDRKVGLIDEMAYVARDCGGRRAGARAAGADHQGERRLEQDDDDVVR